MEESSNKTVGNGFEFTFREVERDWLWKAIPFVPKSVEEPQIKVVNDIEKHYHDFFELQLKRIARDVSKYLNV